MTPPTREPEVMNGKRIVALIEEAVGIACDCDHDATGWFEVTEGYDTYGHYIAPTVQRIADTFDAIVAERDAAVRELEETRKREALSDAIVDECDSDITKLVQERATLRARLAACVSELEVLKQEVSRD